MRRGCGIVSCIKYVLKFLNTERMKIMSEGRPCRNKDGEKQYTWEMTDFTWVYYSVKSKRAEKNETRDVGQIIETVVTSQIWSFILYIDDSIHIFETEIGRIILGL